jgi:hypothetical protein
MQMADRWDAPKVDPTGEWTADGWASMTAAQKDWQRVDLSGAESAECSALLTAELRESR